MQSPPLPPSSASCFTSITLKNNFWLNRVLNWHQYNLCKIYVEGFLRTFNSSLSPCCWSAYHWQISLHLSFFYLSLSSRNINQAQHPRPTCEHLISHQFLSWEGFFWLAILMLYLLRCFSVKLKIIYENMLWCFIGSLAIVHIQHLQVEVAVKRVIQTVVTVIVIPVALTQITIQKTRSPSNHPWKALLHLQR